MLNLQEYVPLQAYSTFGIGGPARFLVEVSSIDELREALQEAKKRRLPILTIGNGSNSLFHDEGFSGLAIVNKIIFIQSGAEGFFQVGAGTSFPKFARTVSQQGWTGLEFGAGIPATVGGAIYMNAGASGQETCERLFSVDAMTLDGVLKRYSREDMHFRYRHSSFQEKKEIICSAAFQFERSESAFDVLQEKFSSRLLSQPYDAKSIGCIFKNPEGHSAGKLIDQAGLKGYSIGGALVSLKHANFIVNTGHATARDVIELAELIVRDVKRQFGITLEAEARIIDVDGISRPLCGSL